MSPQIWRSPSRAARTLLSASKAYGNQTAAAAAIVSLSSKVPPFASGFNRASSESAKRACISGALALPAAAYLLREQEAHAAQPEPTVIVINLDAVSSRMISVIILGLELKGFKLVTMAIGPSKEVERRLSCKLQSKGSGGVVAMICEGEGVKEYVENLVKAMNPDKKSFAITEGQLTYASDGVGETGTRSSTAYRSGRR